MRSYILGVASLADPMSAKIEVSVVLRLDTCLTQLAVCMVPAALDNSVKLDRGQRTLPAGKDRVNPRESTAWNVLLYLDPLVTSSTSTVEAPFPSTVLAITSVA